MRKRLLIFNKPALVVLAACFVFGVFGLLAPAEAQAAKGKPEQTLGYVNRQQVFNSYPGIQEILGRIQTMRTESQKEYDAAVKDLPAASAERQTVNDRIAREQAAREDGLMKPVVEKVAAAVKAVAEEKGLTTVLDAVSVVYGGVDITDAVIKKLQH